MDAVGSAALTPELEAAIRKRRLMRDSDRAALLNLLAQHPWREYAYKVGRWERDESTPQEFWHWFSRDQYHWKRAHDTFQLLDAATGTPVGELHADRKARLAPPSGSVWVAGDPRIVVAYSPAGDGVQTVDLAVSPFVPERAAVDFARTMRAGDQPPFSLIPYQERLPYGRSVWLADRPTKPTRADGYTWNA